MSRSNHSLLAAGVVAVLIAGCGAANDYVFTPEHPSVWVDGYPGAAQALPPERPQGELRLASFGVTELAPDSEQPVVALHVRMVLTNDGDATPWMIDPAEQLVAIDGEGQSRSLLVNTDVDDLPLITIHQREQRVLDFYFPLPATVRGGDELPGFALLWQVRTAERLVAARTVFHREVVGPPPSPTVVYASGWGPRWWFNPAYSAVVFVHPRPFVIHHPGPPPPRVEIRQIPTRHRAQLRDHRR